MNATALDYLRPAQLTPLGELLRAEIAATVRGNDRAALDSLPPAPVPPGTLALLPPDPHPRRADVILRIGSRLLIREPASSDGPGGTRWIREAAVSLLTPDPSYPTG